MSLPIFRRRRELCRALRSISDRQRDAIAVRDYDLLIELIGERRTLIEQLSGLTPSVRAWVADRGSIPPGDRDEGDALLAETNRLLVDAVAADRDAVAALTGQRDATQAELREVASAGRVHAAYRDSLAPVTHRSLDVDR